MTSHEHDAMSQEARAIFPGPHHTIVWRDHETAQWGWECDTCPAIHAAVLSPLEAMRMADRHSRGKDEHRWQS